MFKKIIHFTPLEKPRTAKKSSFWDSLMGFIKYHNAFSIIFMVIFVGFSASLAASPEFRENFVSSQDTVRSVDNSYVLAADLTQFNMQLQIKSVQEDADNYYIGYSYQTIVIRDNVWQPVIKEKSLVVSKKALGDRDLGLFVAEELGEAINYELSYLKEVQQIEKGQGLTQKIVTTQYAGLIGKFLEPKEKVFPGYEPIVKPPEPVIQPETLASENLISYPAEPTPAPAPLPAEVPPTGGTQAGEPVKPAIDQEEIRQIVLELLAQQRAEEAEEQIIEGCTDSQALNYNPDAIADNGSCQYPEPEPEPEPEPQPEPTPEPEQTEEVKLLEPEPLPTDSASVATPAEEAVPPSGTEAGEPEPIPEPESETPPEPILPETPAAE